MSEHLFFLDNNKTELKALAGTSMHALGMKEADIELLLAKHGGPLFGRDLVWIGRQTWASDNQRSDLIGLDASGSLVVAELKRGEAGPDSLTQALGYAANLANLDVDDLAHVWQETGSKASGLVAIAPSTVEDARARLSKKTAVSGAEPNEYQTVIIAAEAFDARLLATCDYLSERLGDESPLELECWEYTIHQLPDVAGYVVTLRQVVPSRTVRDEIAARQEVGTEKAWKPANRLRTAIWWYLRNELAGEGWQVERDGKWYSISARKSGWTGDAATIEFREGAEPVVYLPPGRSISDPKDGTAPTADWSDQKGGIWKRYKLPFSSRAPFTEALGAVAARALRGVT